MSRFSVGDPVKARYRHGDWYTAEIVKVLADAYQVEWYDDGTTSRVKAEEIEPIELESAIVHRFELGDRVFALHENDGWYAATIVGLGPHGYHLQWDGEAGNGRALEHRVERLAKRTAESRKLSPGESVLAPSDGGWFDAIVAAVFANECEVVWQDGTGWTRAPVAELLSYPSSAPSTVGEIGLGGEKGGAKPGPDQALEVGFPELLAFKLYMKRRVESGKLVQVKVSDEMFCPSCRNQHPVNWFEDKEYGVKFFLCNAAAHPAVVTVPPDSRGMKVLTVDELMTEYPALRASSSSWLKKLTSHAQLEITPFPPFVAVVIGRGKK